MSGFFRKFKEAMWAGTYPISTDAIKLLLVDLEAMITASSTTVRKITACTNASPAVATTSANHGFSTNQRVSVSGAAGLTAINGRWAINSTPAANTLTFKDIISGAAVNGNGTFSGTCYVINLDTLDFLDDIDATARVSTSGNLGSKTFTLGVFTFAVATFSAVTSGKTCQAVIPYDSTPGSDGARPVIGVDDQATGLPVLANGGDITYTPNASGFGEI